MSENESPQTDESMIVDPDAEPPEYVTAEGTHTVDEIIPNEENPFENSPFANTGDSDEITLQDGKTIDPIGEQ